MKLASHSLLKKIVKNREISLAELEPFIEKNFSDYRDYFPLAMLCTDGYAKCNISLGSGKEFDEYTLASIFYSSVSGLKNVNNYTASDSPTKPECCKFLVSPKGEFYFSEIQQKRSDRIYSLAIGIIVGICTAILVVKLGVK